MNIPVCPGVALENIQSQFKIGFALSCTIVLIPAHDQRASADMEILKAEQLLASKNAEMK